MFGSIGYVELIVLGIVAVILFGRRLPEVARSVGGSYAQFRKGLSEIQSTIAVDDYSDSGSQEFERSYDDVLEPSGPKFEPPPADDDAPASP